MLYLRFGTGCGATGQVGFLDTDPSMKRHRVAELMDDPALGAAEHRHALAGLARLNRVSASARLAWEPVKRVARAMRGGPVRVIDAACGAADGTIRLACAARKAGITARWTACDVSECALETARKAAARERVELATVRVDLLRAPLPPGHDLAICSLFLHHLDRADAVGVLASMRAAAPSGAVSDLDRTRTGLALAWAASRALSRSRVVHFDAPASVRAAWRPEEALEMARTAGIADARVRRAWPERWVLTWGIA